MKPFNCARLKPRIIAFAIDLLLFAVYLAALFAASLAGLSRLLEQLYPPIFSNPLAFDLFAFVTVILPLTLYFAIMEQSGQGTVGKRVMKIRVVDSTGNRIGFGRSLVRTGLKFLPWQLAHTAIAHITISPEPAAGLLALSIVAQLLALVYIIHICLHKQRQSVYDRIAGTYVVK